MARVDVCFDKLKRLREKVDWKYEVERRKCIPRIYSLISNWTGPLPDLRKIFSQDEIEHLLCDSIKCRRGHLLINFVVRCGYKDQPKVDRDGKTSPRRTTPIHHAATNSYSYYSTLISRLFEIYSDFRVNYVDEETGLTHLHAACVFGCVEVVRKFLELGQDPNLVVTETGESSLHLALKHGNEKSTALLLKHGACPNLTNNEGSTPLHLFCKADGRENHSLAGTFFKLVDGSGLTVRLDARDNRGWTALQWAVVGCKPRLVDVLLDHGADLSDFSFPRARCYAEKMLMPYGRWKSSKLMSASMLMAVVERLVHRGYELKRSDVAVIGTFLAKQKLLEVSPDLDKYWHNEAILSKAKKIMAIPSLSLYDLVKLRPREAEQLLTYSDYTKLAKSSESWELPQPFTMACTLHLGAKMCSGFFRRLAVYPFWELIRHRLPLECCDMILEELSNQDVYNIYLSDQSNVIHVSV